MSAPALPILRNSERTTFKRCQWRWWQTYRMGLKPKETAKPLWFGEGIHLALAHHYKGPGIKRGRNPMKVWRDYVGEEIVKLRVGDELSESEEWMDARALGEVMLIGYFDRYGKDEHMHVIGPEHSFQLTLPAEDGSPLAIIAGTYDLVWRDLREPKEPIWLEEHKTAKAIFTGHLPLDPQAGTYWTTATSQLRAKGIIGKRESLRGIEYNFLRKGKPDARPVNELGQCLNKDGSVSKNQPAPLFVRERVERTPKERQTIVGHLRDEVEQMNLLREGVIAPTKNATRDCSWDCALYNMCILHEQQGDWEEFRDHMFTVRDPYADHRPKSTETGD